MLIEGYNAVGFIVHLFVLMIRSIILSCVVLSNSPHWGRVRGLGCTLPHRANTSGSFWRNCCYPCPHFSVTPYNTPHTWHLFRKGGHLGVTPVTTLIASALLLFISAWLRQYYRPLRGMHFLPYWSLCLTSRLQSTELRFEIVRYFLLCCETDSYQKGNIRKYNTTTHKRARNHNFKVKFHTPLIDLLCYSIDLSGNPTKHTRTKRSKTRFAVTAQLTRSLTVVSVLSMSLSLVILTPRRPMGRRMTGLTCNIRIFLRNRLIVLPVRKSSIFDPKV